MANSALVWTKTETGYEAKSAFGHYVATRTNKGFRFTADDEEISLAKNWLLREVKEECQRIDDARYDAAQKEADARDQLELDTLDIMEKLDSEESTILREKAGEVQVEDEDTGPMIECRACSIASGADRAVFHEPPQCNMTEEDEEKYQRTLNDEEEDWDCSRCGQHCSNCWCDGRRPDLSSPVADQTQHEQSKDHQCSECAKPLSPVERENSRTVCDDCYELRSEEWYRNEGQQLEAEAIKDGELIPTMPVVDRTQHEERMIERLNSESSKEENTIVERPTSSFDEVMLRGRITDEDGVLIPQQSTQHEGGYTLREFSLPSLEVPFEVFRGEGGNTIPNKDPHMSSSPPRVDCNLAKSAPRMGDVVRFTINLLGAEVESEECRVDHVVGSQCKLSLARNGSKIPGMVSNERITIMRRPARIVGGVSVGPWTSSR